MIEVIFGMVLTILLLYVWFHFKHYYIWDPFGFSYIIVTMLQCKECEAFGVRFFERGDYIFKVHEKCPKCKKGDFVIVGIFWERLKTREELKYEKLYQKWR
jgi:hypothetical protein